MSKIISNSMINGRYAEIAEAAKKIFGISGLNADETDILKAKIVRCDQDINYDRFAGDFAKKYWLRNYWKAVHFFEHEYVPKYPVLDDDFSNDIFLRVVVWGAGSAADVAAFMVWANERFPLKVISITLIDRSNRQLDLAKNLLDEAGGILEKAIFCISYQRSDVRAWDPEHDSTDLIIMSHFLTENDRELCKLLRKAKLALRRRGEVIIIERERDAVWKKAAALFANMGISVYDTDLSAEKISRLHPILKMENLEDITPHYIKANLPERKFYADIVTKYFIGWRSQSLDVINDIFSKDAIYDEKPGIEKSIRGINGILDYWKMNPVLQKNIHVYVRNVAYGDSTIVCAFEGDFDTPKQHIAIRGAMNFFIDPYSQKINKLTEYFGTEKTPLKDR